jgi:hypothetical protein
LNNDTIIASIDAEIERLNEARALLIVPIVKPTRVAIRSIPKKAAKKTALQKSKKGTMSPEGRARIAEAQRKRWAATKKVAK